MAIEVLKSIDVDSPNIAPRMFLGGFLALPLYSCQGFGWRAEPKLSEFIHTTCIVVENGLVEVVGEKKIF
jgi:hypothetical protein